MQATSQTCWVVDTWGSLGKETAPSTSTTDYLVTWPTPPSACCRRRRRRARTARSSSPCAAPRISGEHALHGAQALVQHHERHPVQGADVLRHPADCRGAPLPIRSHGPSLRSHDHVLQGLARRGLLLRVLSACGASAAGGRRSAARAAARVSPQSFRLLEGTCLHPRSRCI